MEHSLQSMHEAVSAAEANTLLQLAASVRASDSGQLPVCGHHHAQLDVPTSSSRSTLDFELEGRGPQALALAYQRQDAERAIEASVVWLNLNSVWYLNYAHLKDLRVRLPSPSDFNLEVELVSTKQSSLSGYLKLPKNAAVLYTRLQNAVST